MGSQDIRARGIMDNRDMPPRDMVCRMVGRIQRRWDNRMAAGTQDIPHTEMRRHCKKYIVCYTQPDDFRRGL